MNKILDKYLCEAYPRIFIERSMSVKESCMGRGFECGNGFFPILDSLCNRIQQHIDTHNQYSPLSPIEQFIALQVKEKFGALRIYFKGGDEYCQGLVDMAGDLSYQYCEICGNAGINHVGHTKGWIQSICEDCAKLTKRKITMDKKIRTLLKKAVRKDEKRISDFYASR